jgi:ribonuclease E
MVMDENKDETQSSGPIKAKSGAWWKSTSSGDAAPADPPPQADQSEAASPAAEGLEKPAKAPRKRAPRRPRAAKTTPPAEGQAIEQADPSKAVAKAPAVAEGPPTVVDGPAGEGEPPKKSRRPRKRRSAAKTPAESAVPAPGADGEGGHQGDEPSPGAESVPATADPATTEAVPARKSRSSRSRRGRRSGKKPADREAADLAAELLAVDLTNEPTVAELLAQEYAEYAEQAGHGHFPPQDDPGEDDLFGEDPDDESFAEAEAESEPLEEIKRVYKLLINAEEPEECRLALLEEGRLVSLHVSTVGRAQTKSNIYKARIVAVEPSLQAAFIDYGTDKNGFLPFAEIHPEYYKENLSDEVRRLVEAEHWKKLSITDVIEKGQEVLAQVVKEEIGKKGANMTTYLSIPGRCVVLMPGSDSTGISRKISGEQRRHELREAMAAIDIPEGIGWIVRTAGGDIDQAALKRDVDYLLKLWDEMRARGQAMDGVGLVYEDQQNVLRFLREHFDPAIEEILVDDRDALEQVKAFVSMLPKEQQDVKVRLHQGARPIFNQYSVEDQIESIYQPQVALPSGGSIVIDPTEALVAIDVNSGSTSKGKNFEASIFQANMEAAVELARQLRLRDLGGLIVVDFIDMRSKKNILAVEKQVRMAMKKDKAKVDFSRISKFGLMQISRQKLGAPIEAGNYRRCEHCKGRGTVRSVETQSLYYLRRIQTGASRKLVDRVECRFPLDVASYLLNHKRSELAEMEKRHQVEITIHADPNMKPLDHELHFHKAEKEGSAKKQA